MFDSFKKLSDTIIRKFVDVVDVSNWQIESDEGWVDIETVNKTIPYERYIIKFESGNSLRCADNHIIITSDYEEVFAKDSLGKKIKTNYGDDIVAEVIATGKYENMYDFQLAEDSNHLYYANGILSHNTTIMTIVALYSAVFFKDQTIAIVANKQSTATEIFQRIRLAYLEMENWLKPGVEEWNKTSLTFANGSRIITSATSPDAIRGYSIDVLILDEFAIIPPRDAEAFWAAVTPTLATRFNNNPNAKLLVASTPKGIGNKFHELVTNAKRGKNDFAYEEATWKDVPGRDEEWRAGEISTMGYQMFMQEYECKFLNNTSSPFNPEMFDKFDEERIDPINILENGCYKIWKMPDKDRLYVIGVDTSEGTKQDYSVAQILDITDPLDIEQVAVYASNEIDTTSWSAKVLEIAKQWYSPIICIERNGAGTNPCDKFFYDYHYPRMINHGFNDNALREGRNFRPGLVSTGAIKPQAISHMKYYINDRMCVKIYDQETADELRTFGINKSASGNNIWGAQKGFHDDRVMSLCWALYTLFREVIDTYLQVERNGDGIPIEVKPKWTTNLQVDYANSLYKNLPDQSPFMGIMIGRNDVSSARYLDKYLGKDRPKNLLDYGMEIPLSEYRRMAQLPPSFKPYMR